MVWIDRNPCDITKSQSIGTFRANGYEACPISIIWCPTNLQFCPKVKKITIFKDFISWMEQFRCWEFEFSILWSIQPNHLNISLHTGFHLSDQTFYQYFPFHYYILYEYIYFYFMYIYMCVRVWQFLYFLEEGANALLNGLVWIKKNWNYNKSLIKWFYLKLPLCNQPTDVIAVCKVHPHVPSEGSARRVFRTLYFQQEWHHLGFQLPAGAILLLRHHRVGRLPSLRWVFNS